MQIKIDLKILIFALIFFITNQFNIYILGMFFILIHELFHLIIGHILKFKVNYFEVKPIGFSIGFSQCVDDYNKKYLKSNIGEFKKVFLYLSGPLINLIIAIVVGLSAFNFDYKVEVVYINLLLFIFNMLPIYPLDGGRILKCFVCIFSGIKNSYIVVEKVSNIFMGLLLFVSSLAILYYENIAIIFAVLYIFYMRILYSRINEKRLILYKFVQQDLK